MFTTGLIVIGVPYLLGKLINQLEDEDPRMLKYLGWMLFPQILTMAVLIAFFVKVWMPFATTNLASPEAVGSLTGCAICVTMYLVPFFIGLAHD